MKPTNQLTGAVLEHIKASDPFLQRVYPDQVRKGASSPDIAAFLSGTDLDQDQRGAKLYNPYAESAWIFTAVSILASSVAQIPFRISRVGGGKAKRVRSFLASADPRQKAFVRGALNESIIADGPVVDLFERPHVSMNKQLFWETVVTWNALRGEFFILPQDRLGNTVDLADRAPRIANMVALCPDMFWHIVVGYELEGWRYTGSPLISPVPSEILLPTEVCYSRTPNPYLYWRGLSPLIVALVPAQTDFAGEQFQKGLWVNNADTGVIVTTDQQATKEQQASILQALRERKRKAGTADRPMFLWGGAKVEKPSLSMMDMQFLETRKFLRQEIFAIFKVPEPLAGFTSDVNDGGAGGSLDAIKGSFVESTVSAVCHRCETAVQPIIDTFGDGLVGWFDIDSMPIMQAQRRARLASAQQLFGMGVPMDDINVVLDLGLPERPWYKKGWLPFNLQDASAPTEPLPSEDDPNNAPPSKVEGPDDTDHDDDEAKSNPFIRMTKLLNEVSAATSPSPIVRKPNVKVLWEKHMAARRSSINLFQSKTAKVLNQYRGKALAKLNEIHLEKSAGRMGEIKSLVDLIFNANSFGQSLGDELQAPWQSLLQNAGTELLNEIGAPDDAWKYPPKSLIEFIAGRKQTIMGCGQTVRNQVNTTLEEGVTAGESNSQLADRVRSVFTNMTKSEAKRVASTEVNIGYNNARHQAMTDAGIEYKSWLSSHGPHVRAAHAEAEEAYLDDPIPLTEPFVVMEEELMFPGDDSLGASPENIINCQCVQLAAEKKSEDEKSVTYQIPGLGLMTWQKEAKP
jgi:phage portal protein BeeE